MNITPTDAKNMTDDYFAIGDERHFKIGGNSIKGFVFTREELFRIFQNDASKHVFIMLGLKPNTVYPYDKHISLILGEITPIQEGQWKYSLNTEKFEIGRSVSYPPAVIGMNKYLSEELDPGDHMPKLPALNAHTDFVKHGATSHLYSSTNKKIRGYHLENVDLTNLGLMIPLTDANKFDQFIFTPIIKSERLDGNPFDRPYLSIAVFLSNNDEPEGDAREYCLPCPNNCPKNF